MRKIIIITLLGGLIAIALAGCRKNNNSNDNGTGCITRKVQLVTDVVLNPADYDTARALFLANHLSLDTLQPTAVTTAPPDSSGGVLHDVFYRRYVNGLPVASYTMNYYFYKGRLIDSIFPFTGILTDKDTTTKLNLAQVRRFFLNSHPDTYTYQNVVTAKKNLTHWADSCVRAELTYNFKGLYQTDPSSRNTLIKVWAIYAEQDVPHSLLATITDDDGIVWPTYYFFSI